MKAECFCASSPARGPKARSQVCGERFIMDSKILKVFLFDHSPDVGWYMVIQLSDSEFSFTVIVC